MGWVMLGDRSVVRVPVHGSCVVCVMSHVHLCRFGYHRRAPVLMRGGGHCADPMTYRCAGGLMVEDERIQPYLLKIDGSMDSVMGLGRRATRDLLEAALVP